MLTVSQSRISRKLLVLVMPVALMLAPIGAPLAAAAAPKALINASTVSGPASEEEAIATAAGFTVTVVTDAIWGAMTASEFGAYDLLIAGDPDCGVLPPGLVSSASVYGPVVLGLAGGRTSAGNRIVVGTDPVLHDFDGYTTPGARGTIIREGIGYAGSQPGTTGMYFDSTCGANYYGQSAQTLAILEALSAGGGAWTIDAEPPCGGSVSLIASNPSFADLTTASLQGWSCSVHESFPTFRTDWSALAVATDTDSHPTCGVDPDTNLNACGEAYILIAGSNIVVNSLVISVSPLDSTNPVGTSHTVTANVHAVGGTPVVAGQLVDFSVTGQNAGAIGTCAPVDCKSDVNGNVTFTYADTNGAGDDTIKASFTDGAGSLQTATAQKHWTSGETGQIKIVKTATGGDATFNFTVTGPTPATPSVTTAGGNGDTTITVNAGSGYGISEDPQANWAQGTPSCDSGTPASFTVTAGGTVTCTFSNTFEGEGNTLSALSDAHLWLGLRNSDDQGTQFDVKVELFRDAESTPLASGLKRCVTSLTRNQTFAKDVIVVWDAFSPVSLDSGDVLKIVISTRIGTTSTGAKCPGPGGSHNNARALRFYYDLSTRNSRFDATIGGTNSDLYFDSDGGGCDKPVATTDSKGVTTRYMNPNPPPTAPALVKCKDSGNLNFNGGNPYTQVGTWTLP